MPIDTETVERLEARAQQVGEQIGWDLHFRVTPSGEHVCLTVGTLVVKGPAPLDKMAAHDMEIDLELLASGERRIVRDDEGDIRLF